MVPGSEGEPTGGTRLAFQDPGGPGLELFALPFPVERELFVADQSVGPEVGHLDFQSIPAGFDRAGNLAPERRLPANPQRLTVKSDLSQVFHAPQVEPQLPIRAGEGRGQVELFGIGGGAREVLHAVVGLRGPGLKLRKLELCRGTPAGGEGHIPGPVEHGRRGHRFQPSLALTA